MAELTEAERRCLTAALDGLVHPPATGAYRMRSGELREPGCFSRATLRRLTDRGLLRPIDIECRAITEAGRQALKDRP
jgi:hypothetical protein